MRCQPPEGQLLRDWLGTGLPGMMASDFLSRVLLLNFYYCPFSFPYLLNCLCFDQQVSSLLFFPIFNSCHAGGKVGK